MLKKNLLFPLISILLLMTNINAQKLKLNLMPFPSSVELTNGKFVIDTLFAATIGLSSGKRIAKAGNKLLRRISDRTGTFLSNPYIVDKGASVTISAKRIGELRINEDESYNLTITTEKISIEAETDLGAMHAMETLLQLVTIDENGYYFPTLKIKDAPRYTWRGVMYDISRHFMPIEVLKRNLDGMASVKMNVFHWHITDDQGVRFESKKYPKLNGASNDGLYYTHEQIKEVINYAADLGIRVVPEIDIPGHATAWFAAFPEYASAPGPYKIERRWGIFDPTFDPTKEETYVFFKDIFEELFELFPDEYFHIGGDENNGKQWDANKNIQEWMKANDIADNRTLQSYFNNRLLKILTDNNKKMVGWDEILHEDMPTNIVIQSWRGKESLGDAAKKGYQGLLSNGYYIDLMQPTEYHYLNDPIDEDSDLTNEEKSKILGGEATMWAELITPETIDSRVWPRTATIAERFWSPQYIKDVDDMFRRLEYISYLLEEHGLQHITFQPKMLRRLTNNQCTKALKILIDALEPLEEYKRYQSAKQEGFRFKQHSPYTRVMDACIVDTKPVMLFNKNVADYIENKNLETSRKIREQLTKWAENHEKLKPIIATSPILKEVTPLSENLSLIAKVGLEAISLIEKNEKPSAEWMDNAKVVIENSKKWTAQMEIVVIDSIGKLVETTN